MVGDEVVNMRTEKGTRTKFLPPKIQKQQIRIKPVRTSFRFIDNQVIDFNVSGTINAGNGWISGSQQLVGKDVFTTLNIPGGVVTQTAVSSIEQVPTFLSGVLGPYKDNDKPELDAGTNSFYLTGSRVIDMGDGFLSPLHDKIKFEIDLTPTSNTSFGLQNFTSGSNNFVMGYWNNVLKRYEGKGSGREFANYNTSSIPALIRFHSRF